MDSSTAESGVVDNWVIAAGISEAETSDAAEGSFILGFSDTADLFTSFCSKMDKAVECAADFSEFPLEVVSGIIFLNSRDTSYKFRSCFCTRYWAGSSCHTRCRVRSCMYTRCRIRSWWYAKHRVRA